MKVENMTSNKGNKVPNQFIISDDKKEYFQSYNTVIACRDWTGEKMEFYLDPKWNYSRTTMKYLNQFLGVTGKKEVEQGIKSGKYIVRNLN